MAPGRAHRLWPEAASLRQVPCRCGKHGARSRTARTASRLPSLAHPPCLEQAASWALLACVMKGFAVSVVSPPAAPPSSLTAEQLVTYLAPKLNAARDLRAKIFGCSDPRLALCAPQVETTGMKRRNMVLALPCRFLGCSRATWPREGREMSSAPSLLPPSLHHHC